MRHRTGIGHRRHAGEAVGGRAPGALTAFVMGTAVFLCGVSGEPLRAAEVSLAPKNGQAMDAPDSRTGFLVYFAPMGIWVDPDVFWYRWADAKKAFLWNGAAEVPTSPEVEDGNMFIIETDAGPCLLVHDDGRWRKASSVYGWEGRIRDHGGCPSLGPEFD